MRRTSRSTAIAAVVAGLLLAPATALASGTLPATWQRGMNFTSWTAGGYGSDDARHGLDELAAVGTDRVVLTPTWYMDGATSSTVVRDAAKTPSDDALRSVIGAARSRGMSVVLKPHVDVRDGTFRGDIAPLDRGAWFRSYGAMLDHYAALASATGADTLVVGTELTSMATDTAAFDGLIAQARARFAGTVTYAANWVDEAEQVGFWDRLDAVGMDAYMPLATGSESPTVDELAGAWTPYVQRITDLHARTGKPVMFTELGYQSRSDTLDHPASASGSADPEIQAVAYAAALRVWRTVPWFRGIWWWNWQAEPTGEDPAGSFTVAGKPAAAVLRAAQGGTAVNPGVNRSGATAPVGVGVLILTVAAGLGLAALRRRRPAFRPPAPTTPALTPTAPRAAAGPWLTLVEPAPAVAPTGLSPAPGDGRGGALPPRLAAACMVPTGAPVGPALRPAAPHLPSRYQGVAA